MELKFLKDNIDRNRYLITENSLLYTAVYNKTDGNKKLFDVHGNLLGIGYRLETKTYGIDLQNQQVIINYKPWFRPLYSFTYEGKEYQGIVHFGSKLSIFENGEQIAYYISGGLLRDADWEMKLVANSDIKKDLWCLFCLHAYSDFMDEHASEGGNPSFNLSPQLKKFDKSWRPK